VRILARTEAAEQLTRDGNRGTESHQEMGSNNLDQNVKGTAIRTRDDINLPENRSRGRRQDSGIA